MELVTRRLLDFPITIVSFLANYETRDRTIAGRSRYRLHWRQAVERSHRANDFLLARFGG